MVVVPAAEPRSCAGTELKTAAKMAGVRKATPSASTTVPASMPAGFRTAPRISSPAVQRASDPAASFSGGSRSGTRANTIRHVTTIPP